MSALKDFQLAHGQAWAAITQSEAFLAALGMANLEKHQQIRTLSNAEIAAHGSLILADYRGHMNYEDALLGLHEKKEFVFQQLPPEEYPDPEREAEEAAMLENAGQPESTFTGAIGGSIHEQLFPPPPRRKRGRPPGKKKKK